MSHMTAEHRNGLDLWDEVCAIQTYGFIHSDDNSQILKAKGIGCWIDQHEVLKIVERAQRELNELRAKSDLSNIKSIQRNDVNCCGRTDGKHHIHCLIEAARIQGWALTDDDIASAIPPEEYALIKAMNEQNESMRAEVEALKAKLAAADQGPNQDMPWKLPPLSDWAIVGMNHYHINGVRHLFVSMSKDGMCITSEGHDNWVVWNDLCLQADAASLREGDPS